MATAVCGRMETSSSVRALWSIRNRRSNGIRRHPITVDRRGSSPDYVGQASRRYRLGGALHQHSAFPIPQSPFAIGQASSRYRSAIFHLPFLKELSTLEVHPPPSTILTTCPLP